MVEKEKVIKRLQTWEKLVSLNKRDRTINALKYAIDYSEKYLKQELTGQERQEIKFIENTRQKLIDQNKSATANTFLNIETGEEIIQEEGIPVDNLIKIVQKTFNKSSTPQDVKKKLRYAGSLLFRHSKMYTDIPNRTDAAILKSRIRQEYDAIKDDPVRDSGDEDTNKRLAVNTIFNRRELIIPPATSTETKKKKQNSKPRKEPKTDIHDKKPSSEIRSETDGQPQNKPPQQSISGSTRRPDTVGPVAPSPPEEPREPTDHQPPSPPAEPEPAPAAPDLQPAEPQADIQSSGQAQVQAPSPSPDQTTGPASAAPPEAQPLPLQPASSVTAPFAEPQPPEEQPARSALEKAETMEEVKSAIFERAGQRNAGEVVQLIEKVSDILENERLMGTGKILATIREMKDAGYSEVVHDGGVVYIPDTQGKLTVVGDIHGDSTTVRQVVERSEFLENMVKGDHSDIIVFEGDYLDRGEKQIEVMEILLELKKRYPKNTILMKADHDFGRSSNQDKERLGYITSIRPRDFERRVSQKFGTDADKIISSFDEVFYKMPHLTVSGNGVVMLHGGPPNPQFIGLDHTPDLKELVNNDRAFGLMEWGDPDANLQADYQRDDSRVYIYGKGAVEKFLSAIGGNVLIRAHEYDVDPNPFDNILWTIHSTGEGSPESYYGSREPNPTFAQFDRNITVTKIDPDIHIIPVWKTKSTTLSPEPPQPPEPTPTEPSPVGEPKPVTETPSPPPPAPPSPQPPPSPSPPPTPDQLSKDIFILRRDEDMRKRAREIAEEQLQAKLREGKRYNPADIFKRALVRITEEYHRQKYTNEILQQMRVHNTPYLYMNMAKKAADRTADDLRQEKEKTQEAGKAKIHQLRTQATEDIQFAETEGKISEAQGELKNAIVREIIRPILEEKNNPHNQDKQISTEEDVQNTLKHFMEQYEREHPDDEEFKKTLGRKGTQYGTLAEFFASDILEMANQVKQDFQAHNFALDELDKAINIRLANPAWGAYTEMKPGITDKIVAWAESKKLRGYLVNPATIGAAASVATYTVLRATGTAAGTIAKSVPAVGLAFSLPYVAMKRNHDLQIDRAMHQIDRAYGEKIPDNAQNRSRLEKYAYDTATVGDLLDSDERTVLDTKIKGVQKLTNQDLSNTGNRDGLILSMAEIKSRLDYSFREKVDLITYEGRYEVEQGKARLTDAYTAARRKLIESGMSEEEINRLEYRKTQLFERKFEQNKLERDRAFTRYKYLSPNAGADMVFAATIGLSTGLLIKEMAGGIEIRLERSNTGSPALASLSDRIASFSSNKTLHSPLSYNLSDGDPPPGISQIGSNANSIPRVSIDIASLQEKNGLPVIQNPVIGSANVQTVGNINPVIASAGNTIPAIYEPVLSQSNHEAIPIPVQSKQIPLITNVVLESSTTSMPEGINPIPQASNSIPEIASVDLPESTAPQPEPPEIPSVDLPEIPENERLQIPGFNIPEEILNRNVVVNLEKDPPIIPLPVSPRHPLEPLRRDRMDQSIPLSNRTAATETHSPRLTGNRPVDYARLRSVDSNNIIFPVDTRLSEVARRGQYRTLENVLYRHPAVEINRNEARISLREAREAFNRSDEIFFLPPIDSLGRCIITTGYLNALKEALAKRNKDVTINVFVNEQYGDVFDRFSSNKVNIIKVKSEEMSRRLEETVRSSDKHNPLILDFQNYSTETPVVQNVKEGNKTVSAIQNLLAFGLSQYNNQTDKQERFSRYIEELFSLPRNTIDPQQAQPRIELPPNKDQIYSDLANRFNIDASKPQIAISVDSLAQENRYSMERWAETIDRLSRVNPDYRFIILFNQDNPQPGFTRNEMEQILTRLNLLGKVRFVSANPTETAILLEKQKLVISNNNDIAYLSAALRNGPKTLILSPVNGSFANVWTINGQEVIAPEKSPTTPEEIATIINTIDPRAIAVKAAMMIRD